MSAEWNRLQQCLAAVRERTGFVPEVGVVLGSGLGEFADTIRQVAVIDYHDIPGFPVSTAPGHIGRFVFGYVEDTPVVVMQGRIHYYEGYAPKDVVLPARLMALMGAKIFFVTNASGGLHADWKPGTLMLIRDHFAPYVPNPLIGENVEELGPRFPDMTDAYDPALGRLVKAAAEKNGIDLKEGVYVQFSGPSYETAAEVRFMAKLGADAVGMSTAMEVIAARHTGMKVVGVSCIANPGTGISDVPLTEEMVLDAARETAPRFRALLWDSLRAMHGAVE